MPCTGQKVNFTKQEAEEALKKIRHQGRQHSREQRKYYCSDCNCWHLTSQPEKKNQHNFRMTYFDKWKQLLNQKVG